MKRGTKKTRIILAAVIFLHAAASAQMQRHQSEQPLSADGSRASMHERGDHDNYRGRRMMPGMNHYDGGERTFFVEKISIKDAHHYLLINMFFTFPLDPRSVKAQNIYLNGSPLPDSAIVKFSRMGNILQIIVNKTDFTPDPYRPDGIRLSCGGICRFDGEPLGERYFDGLAPDETYIFTE